MIGLVAAAFAATYDLAPGDSLDSLTLVAGDQVLLAPGEYPQTAVMRWTAAGTDGAPIVIQGDGGEARIVLQELAGFDAGGAGGAITLSGEWVRVEGVSLSVPDSYESFNGLVLDGVDHVTLSDIAVSGATAAQLRLSNDTSNVHVEYAHLYRGGAGIRAGCSDASCWSTDATFTQNWIHDVGEGVVVYHGGNGTEISDNVVHAVEDHGIYVGSTDFATEHVIEGNALWGADSYGIRVQGASLVRNNVIFNLEGIGLAADDPGRNAFEGVILSHNTVGNSGDWAAQLVGWEGQIGLVFANNALCNPDGYGFQYIGDADGEAGDTAGTSEVDPGNRLIGNVVCGLVEGPDSAAGHYATGGGFGDFVNPENWDYYPSDGSALVNTADADGASYLPEVDFNGAPRDGEAPDVGAYEWDGDGNPGWALREGFKEVEHERELEEEIVGSGCCGADGQSAWLIAPLLGFGIRRRRH